MTQQEIGEAAREYAQSLEPIAFKNLKGEEMPYLLRGAFREGLKFANKHWREKTRWKSLLAEPPKEPKPFEEVYLLLKHSDGGYAIKLSVSQNSVNYWLSEGFIAWKEIE